MVRLFSVALLALVAGAMAGCRDEPLRQYRAPRQPLDRTWLEFTKGAPEGWQRVSAAGRQFVEHAFAIGPAEHGLETTVSRLARQNIEGEAALAENINRWRRQLGLPPVPADEVHKHVAESFDQPQPAGRTPVLTPSSIGLGRLVREPSVHRPAQPPVSVLLRRSS